MDSRQEATFPKQERLFLKHQIDLLFEQGASFIAYPLRVLYLPRVSDDVMPSVLISVPKRRIRKAVHRNRIKRQIREAYRQRKNVLIERVAEREHSLLLAFLYLGDALPSSSEVIEKAMERALMRLGDLLTAGDGC